MRAVNMRVLDVVEKIYKKVMPMLSGGEMLFYKICSTTWVARFQVLSMGGCEVVSSVVVLRNSLTL